MTKHDTGSIVSIVFFYVSARKGHSFKMNTTVLHTAFFAFREKFADLLGEICFNSDYPFHFSRDIEIAEANLSTALLVATLSTDCTIHLIDPEARRNLKRMYWDEFTEAEHSVLKAIAEAILAMTEEIWAIKRQDSLTFDKSVAEYFDKKAVQLQKALQ